MRFLMKSFFIVFVLTVFLRAEGDYEEFAAHLAKDAYMLPIKLNAKYMGRYKIRSYDVDGVRFFKLSNKTTDYIMFRGTDNAANWLTNLSVSAVPFDDVMGATVHSGFYGIAKEALKQLMPNKDSNIVVCGHSLGGAVALLVGAILYEEGYDVEVITFGAPPVGNEAFVEAFESLPHVRFEHLFDLVPKADKASIAKIKSLLDEIDPQTAGYDSLRDALVYLKTMPYTFIQHGEGRLLTHILGMKNPLSAELLDQPVRYHSMESYLKAFEEE